MERAVKQVLLIAANPWTEGLVQEAANEIRDGRILAHDYQMAPVASLGEAMELIERAPFDLILVDPYVPECRPMDAFLELRAAARDFPIVLLCGRDDESLATRALREGAQDYLIIDELDCLPFARTLRNAIDRFSASWAGEPVTFHDSVTGLYNKHGFLLLAGYMLKLARLQGAASALLMLEFEGTSQPRNREHEILRLLDLSDAVRSALGETEIAGRLSDGQFAVAAVGAGRESLERLRNALAVTMPEVRVGFASSGVAERKMAAAAAAAGSGMRGAVAAAALPVSIHDLIDAAAACVCENYSKDPIPAH